MDSSRGYDKLSSEDADNVVNDDRWLSKNTNQTSTFHLPTPTASCSPSVENVSTSNRNGFLTFPLSSIYSDVDDTIDSTTTNHSNDTATTAAAAAAAAATNEWNYYDRVVCSSGGSNNNIRGSIKSVIICDTDGSITSFTRNTTTCNNNNNNKTDLFTGIDELDRVETFSARSDSLYSSPVSSLTRCESWNAFSFHHHNTNLQSGGSSRLSLKSLIFEFDPLYNKLVVAENDEFNNELTYLNDAAAAATNRRSSVVDIVNHKTLTTEVGGDKRNQKLIDVETNNNSNGLTATTNEPPTTPSAAANHQSVLLGAAAVTYNDNNNDDDDNDSTISVKTTDNHEKQFVALEKIKNKLFKLKKSNSSATSRWTAVKRAIRSVSSEDVQPIGSSNYNTNYDGGHNNGGTATMTEVCFDGKLKKPTINTSLVITLHNGFLLKSSASGDKIKDFVQRWCQLSEGKLFYSADKSITAKHCVNLDTVLSIRYIQDNKMSYNGSDVHCFEIFISTRSRPYVFGALCTTERRVWMQKLIENLTWVFPARYTADYTRSGWCFMKESFNGTWIAAWILLQKRTFVYSLTDGSNKIVEVDLRKARFVGLNQVKDNDTYPEMKHMLLLDTTTRSLYLTMEKSSETTEWYRIIKGASVDNGIQLDDQQLTNDNVPVIIDKCINFVYTHGSMSEGIYRRSGSHANVTKLLSLFRQDAWSVQLNRQEYSEYDVSNVLKRFFRDLPEPLFSSSQLSDLRDKSVAAHTQEAKLAVYGDMLEKLSPVNYVTIKKVLGHLYFIHQLKDKNLMPVENLAALWGPTLMHSQENGESLAWSRQQSEFMGDLILLYPKLFVVREEELEREQEMKGVLEKYHSSSSQLALPVKRSGDLKIWIYVHSKNSGESISVTVDPNKDCIAVFTELGPKMGISPQLLFLHEYVSDGRMIRPIHYREKPFDVVLRWGYWNELDRKDNYLVVSTASVIQEILPLARYPLSISGELKFADQKSKSFKSYLFEFGQSKLICYKDKKGTVKLHEWNVEDIAWYIGHEQKRDPHTKWSMTFISRKFKPNRTKDCPYFGCTIGGNDKENHLRWIAALLTGEHSSNLLPSIPFSK